MSRINGNGFRPAFWLPGAHLQTIVPTLLPGPSLTPAAEARLVEVDPGSQIQVLISRPTRAPRGTLILVHGLGGNAESGYMRRTASMALQKGWITLRVNLRNCGGTEALARTLYNAGQSGDAGRVLEAIDAWGLPRPYALVGFSLGGNLALRYAGLAGDGCRADEIIGVNPPVDLEACVRCLEESRNAFYHHFFTWKLLRMLRRIRRHRATIGPPPRLGAIRTLRRFDTLYTAPDGGFSSAEDYYLRASAGPHLGKITVPALILSSLNDPLIPPRMFSVHGRGGAMLRFMHPPKGGHVGYWQSGSPRFWAGEAILDYLERPAGVRLAGHPPAKPAG